ncbi:MAG: hypothetical protein K2P93_03605 [Alphaproteobacteria bacterium]|nr:hypothetical protein [Alphaproteobacteria bacterium]
MDQEKLGVGLKIIHPNQPEDVKRRARHIVRSLVQDNLEPILNPNKESLCPHWVSLKWELKLNDNNHKLDQQILDYLQTGVDPELRGCNESFKGVREALMKEGIVLDAQNRLKLLTPEEQHAEVIKGVRPIVLYAIYKNIESYIFESKKSDSIKIEFNGYYAMIASESHRVKLDQDIVKYLMDGQDPKYYGCPFSFKGIREELKINEIVLNEQTRTLRFLTEREKRLFEEECKKLILDFTEI